jgi:hypothetical protein
MFILQFYRFFLSLLSGILTWLFIIKSLWIILPVTIVIRMLWFLIEKSIRKSRINKWFKNHETQFKELTGPYGIRLMNKAENDSSVKESLAEVFTPSPKELQKTVEQLEVMDTLFKSGLRPDGDSYQLHDLKLKYAKYRIEKNI